jgi:hypothetical protein
MENVTDETEPDAIDERARQGGSISHHLYIRIVDAAGRGLPT